MDTNTYRKKVMGCWLGKAVGGTLGQPYEGCNGPLSLDYYNPVPTDMIPNDDLDLQVLWACVMDRMERPVVDRDVLAGAWLKHVHFPWDEYGIAIRNLRNGIAPPESGRYDNWFKDGLGAAIRSEIWACLAPGDPELAARYAYEDACVDHCGDGIFAEQFLAALQSAAFACSDIDELIAAGLNVIPPDCRIARAIRDTRQWCGQSTDFLAIRKKILAKWGSENFTDCVMNISFAVMALLLGRGDFSASICISANCGRDADCSTATVGAILGLVDPDCIEERWLKPIGRKLVINDGVVGISPPDTLDGFTDLIMSLRDRVALRDARPKAKPDISGMAITAEAGPFRPWFAQDENRFSPTMPERTETLVFDGALCRIPSAKVPPDSLFLMRFTFQLDRARTVRVMFNSPSNARVWVDGKYAFGREGGRMAPSFHRCPPNQYKDMALAAGEHELLAGVAPIGDEQEIAWNMGVGAAEDFQWISDAFGSGIRVHSNGTSIPAR